MPGEHAVHQVAELVEEGHHVAVLHEPGIVRITTREIAYQSTLRDLDALDPVPDSEAGGVGIFPRAGMEIEVEAADQSAPVVDLVRVHAGMPHLRVFEALVADPEDL